MVEMLTNRILWVLPPHVYQGGMSQYSANLGFLNMEFKQALFMDITKKTANTFQSPN